MATRTTSALASDTETVERKKPDYALLAHMVIREGKSFAASALAAGYSQSVAAAGLKVLMATSRPLAEAIRKEAETLNVAVDKLKPYAINRLYMEIIDPDSTQSMKAIELAGRFKETDWFVRNNETATGILITVGEQTPDTAIDVPVTYKE